MILPLKRYPGSMSAPVREKRSSLAGPRDRGRVLLLSEEPIDLVAEALAHIGLEIVGVSRGSAALLSLQRSRPHIVVASAAVKGITSAELSRMLSQTQDGVPLIVFGPEAASVERRRRVLSAGAFDYFQLPSEIDLLCHRVSQLVVIRQTMDRLRADAALDYLTGLANRRRFRKKLGDEVERWRRYGVPCALLLLDIDHLKKINDQFGHSAGDVVIRFVADTLRSVLRENDTAARMGGEEFALLLSGATGEKGRRAAERL